MRFEAFSKTPNDATKEPMFLGQPVNVARYDQQRYPLLESLVEKQMSFLWRPEEVDVTADRSDYQRMQEHERHIFVANLKYQSLLDSVQGRSPSTILEPIASLPELENWLTIWQYSESVHSRSYTHIIRSIMPNPAEVFDDIMVNEEIMKRAVDVSRYYDDLYEAIQYYQMLGVGTHEVNGETVVVSMRDIKKKLYLCLMSVNVLEAIRFYVSFSCNFAFAENDRMSKSAVIMKLIQRDEALHLVGTQFILNKMRSGLDDMEFAEIAMELEDECVAIFKAAAQQEKDWAEYLFKDGSLIGLNVEILSQYIDYITNERMRAVGLPPAFPETKNPITWMNNWLASDAVQSAPQERENGSYLVGQIDSSVPSDHFDGQSLD